MLILTRKVDQTITLGDPSQAASAIEITVIEVRGDQVRLGITAPRDVPVDRLEIWQQRRSELDIANNQPSTQAE